jgi:signal transduction histidine kinase
VERIGIYEAVVSPIVNSDNRVTSVVIVARDITLRKQQEAEKLKLALEQERVQLMSRFFQAISHDFRTSLSIIEANRYLVSSGLNDDAQDKTAKRLSHIQDSVLRMNTQIDNLSVLSSLTERRNTPFDLNSIVMNAVNLQTAASKRKNQKLSFERAAELPHAIGEAREIQRAIEFVINNATNFTEEGGTITVRTFIHYTQENGSTLSQNGVIEGTLPRFRRYWYRAEHRPGDRQYARWTHYRFQRTRDRQHFHHLSTDNGVCVTLSA